MQFFIAPVANWLRTRRFSEPTFRPSGATNHWKNTVFRDFPTFSRICIFCLLTLSLLIFSLLIFLFSLPLPCSAFHLSILSEVWLLNFLRIYRRSSAESCQYRLSISLSLFGFDMDTFCVENGHICFLIPNASRGQRWFQTCISSFLLFFLLLSSDLLSVLQQVSFSKCAKQQIQILLRMLPAWVVPAPSLLNDPPA